MPHLLNIQPSPRRGQSASIAVSNAFLAVIARRIRRPRSTSGRIDTLDVWEEDLPEFEGESIGTKYKAVSGDGMDAAETAVWERIESFAARFQKADRIVLGVPMWNFAYLYKLKQLIDLVCQRGRLFRFDGKVFGPMLETPRALIIYSQGQS